MIDRLIGLLPWFDRSTDEDWRPPSVEEIEGSDTFGEENTVFGNPECSHRPHTIPGGATLCPKCGRLFIGSDDGFTYALYTEYEVHTVDLSPEVTIRYATRDYYTQAYMGEVAGEQPDSFGNHFDPPNPLKPDP